MKAAMELLSLFVGMFTPSSIHRRDKEREKHREARAKFLLESNRSRTAPKVERETRQQVRAQGRDLEKRINSRHKRELKASRHSKRSTSPTSEAFRQAAKESRGWFSRRVFR